MSNNKVLEEGLKKAREMVKQQLSLAVRDAAVEMIKDAVNSIGFKGLTGNTISSLSVGIYIDGALSDIVTSVKDAGVENATRPKITRNEGRNGYLVITSYVTHDKQVVKTHQFVETDGRYGDDSAMAYLRQYKPSNALIELVMCTGTEYSAYLETVRDLNVLTFTYHYAESILKRNINKYFR